MNGEVWAEPNPESLAAADAERRRTHFIPYLVGCLADRIPGMLRACSDSYRQYFHDRGGTNRLLDELSRIYPEDDSVEDKCFHFLNGLAYVLGYTDEQNFNNYLQNPSVDLDFTSPFCQMTLLHHAIVQDKQDLISTLLQHRSEIDAGRLDVKPRSEEEKTALRKVNATRRVLTVFTPEEYLLGNVSCLWLAVAMGNLEMVALILSETRPEDLSDMDKCMRIQTFPRNDPMSSLSCVPESVRTVAVDAHPLKLGSYQESIPVSVWHFVISSPEYRDLFQLLTQHLPIPFHIAAQLVAFGHQDTADRIWETILTAQGRWVAVQRVSAVGNVVWTQTAIHHHTLGLMGLNDTNYGREWNFYNPRFQTEVVLAFLSVAPLTPAQRQIQAMFLQLSLVAICTSRNRSSPYSRRDQLFLLEGIVSQEVRLHGWSEAMVEVCGRILMTSSYLDDPYYGLGHTFFHSAMDLRCEKVKWHYIRSNNPLMYCPLVLRLCAQPFPLRLGPHAVRRTMVTFLPDEEDKMLEDYILHFLWRGLSDLPGIVTSLDLIPIDPFNHRLHDGPLCFEHNGGNLHDLPHAQVVGWDHGWVFQEQAPISYGGFISPLQEYILDRPNLLDVVEQSTHWLRQVRSLDQLIRELQERLRTRAECDAIWPGSYVYLPGAQRQQMPRRNRLRVTTMRHILDLYRSGAMHCFEPTDEELPVPNDQPFEALIPHYHRRRPSDGDDDLDIVEEVGDDDSDEPHDFGMEMVGEDEGFFEVEADDGEGEHIAQHHDDEHHQPGEGFGVEMWEHNHRVIQAVVAHGLPQEQQEPQDLDLGE